MPLPLISLQNLAPALFDDEVKLGLELDVEVVLNRSLAHLLSQGFSIDTNRTLDDVRIELRNLVGDDGFRDPIGSRRLGQKLRVTRLVEAVEEKRGLIDGPPDRQQPVILEDAGETFRAQCGGDGPALFLGNGLAAMVVVDALDSVEVAGV